MLDRLRAEGWARDALDQGRDVLAVPGHPFDARAAGCNALIREGAPLIRSAQDVIDFLAPFANVPAPFERPPRSVAPKRAEPPKKPEKTWDMAAIHKKVLQMLGPSPVAEDQLIRDLNVSPSQVAPVLIDLELDGKIERQPGGLLTKT